MLLKLNYKHRQEGVGLEGCFVCVCGGGGGGVELVGGCFQKKKKKKRLFQENFTYIEPIVNLVNQRWVKTGVPERKTT